VSAHLRAGSPAELAQKLAPIIRKRAITRTNIYFGEGFGGEGITQNRAGSQIENRVLPSCFLVNPNRNLEWLLGKGHRQPAHK